MFLYITQGIGGNNVLPFAKPLNLPSLIASMNCSSFHVPIPVESEVRFAVKDTPHGPTHEVRSPVTTNPLSCISFRLTSGVGEPAICPARARSISSTGPCAVIFFGVWQSWQAPRSTRCSPHFTWLSKPAKSFFPLRQMEPPFLNQYRHKS